MSEPIFLQTKEKLYHNSKIQICRSEVHRWGVFATKDIKQHEVLEESPYFSVPLEEVACSPSCEAYTYWLQDGYSLIGMGYAGLYNHSLDPNADYQVDKISETITHYALRDIAAGTEVFINYGVENAAFFGAQSALDQSALK